MKKKMKKITLYVVRIGNDDTLRNSAPCTNCFDVIREMGIKRIVFSNENGEIISTNTNSFTTTHFTHGTRAIQDRNYKQNL